MQLHTPTGFATGHQFLEGLRWHDGALWASDFFAGTVLTFAPDGDAATVARVPGAPSGLGFLPDGTPLVVSQTDATIQRIGTDGALSTYADFSDIAGGPGNDLLVTSDGHAYAGNFGFAVGTEDPRPTALAHVDPHGAVRRVEGDVLFPNGMALTSDGRLLLAETFLHRITAYHRAARRDPVGPARLGTAARDVHAGRHRPRHRRRGVVRQCAHHRGRRRLLPGGRGR